MMLRYRLRRVLLCALAAWSAPGVGAQEVCDAECVAGDDTVNVYKVVSPVGHQAVEMITMAPRLTTLEGKTIALVGGSFMASVTHLELKKLILSQFPTARVYLLDEIGSAGPYPAPGVVRKPVEEFKQRLRDYGVDAVIAGNGGCGICTPKEAGSAIAAEYIGIPAVMVAAPGFDRQAVTTAYNYGVPALRVATYPGAFATHTNQQLADNTRSVVWPQVLQKLTTDITDEEIAANRQTQPDDPRTIVFNASIAEVNDFFSDMQWSDGLPVVPPTAERVSQFLKFTDQPWDATVAVLPPAMRQTLVWHVAVNGVMAGCRPEYMPILIALTKAMAGGDFRRPLTSTHAWMPYCWLNGPVARQLGFGCGQGQMNREANMALGRFMNLALQNFMGLYVGQNRMGTFGYPMAWSMAEDEEACLRVGWRPYHQRHGYSLSDNTVTACSTLQWGNNMAPATADGGEIMQLLAWDIADHGQLALSSGVQFTDRTILLTEEAARRLQQRYGTPDVLEDTLVTTARRPLHERAYAHYYANPGSAIDPGKVSLDVYRKRLGDEEQAGLTRTPEWYATDAGQMLTIPTMQPGQTHFLVTGSGDDVKLMTMPGGGTSTAAVELPAGWDALMAEKGYPPLQELTLETPRSILVTAETEYSTYVATENLNFDKTEGLEAYVVTSVGGSAACLERVLAVPKGTPLVLKRLGSRKTYGVAIAATAAAPAVNLLVGGPAELTGDGTEYILVDGVFHRSKAGHLAAGKACLKWVAGGARLALSAAGVGTAAGSAARSSDDGTHDAYGLDGIRAAEPGKGIRIQNGKKEIRK